MNGILLVLIGVLSGVLSGMGIGGGVVLIPALSIFFSVRQQTAQSINLLYFIPTAVIALITHVKNKKVETKILPGIIITGMIGAVTGSLVAIAANPDVLRKFFGGFLLLIGTVEVFKKPR